MPSATSPPAVRFDFVTLVSIRSCRSLRLTTYLSETSRPRDIVRRALISHLGAQDVRSTSPRTSTVARIPTRRQEGAAPPTPAIRPTNTTRDRISAAQTWRIPRTMVVMIQQTTLPSRLSRTDCGSRSPERSSRAAEDAHAGNAAQKERGRRSQTLFRPALASPFASKCNLNVVATLSAHQGLNELRHGPSPLQISGPRARGQQLSPSATNFDAASIWPTTPSSSRSTPSPH